MQASNFSFFVHFRKSIRKDISLFWKPMGLLPEGFYENLFRKFVRGSITWSQVVHKQNNAAYQSLGSIELVPMSAAAMLKDKREDFVQKMEQYLDGLVKRGVKIAGLGALTAPLTNGGLALQHRTDIALTNGNAFTAVMMAEAVQKIVAQMQWTSPKIAIVGATGSVGSCVSKLLAQAGYTNLLLMSQTLPKLQRLKNGLVQNDSIQISTHLGDLTQAQLVVVLTASDSTIIHAEHLQHGAVILDGTQPRNTAPTLLKQRPDITLIDGGLVSINEMALKGGGFGLPKGVYFACFSETVLLALEAYDKHFCLGNASVEQAEYIKSVAQKYRKYGFQLAPFSAFGKPVQLPMPHTELQNIEMSQAA